MGEGDGLEGLGRVGCGKGVGGVGAGKARKAKEGKDGCG